ncbi:tat-2 [Pristionchus pacificus]|nr:tat-2 [Pristionchus pacificus]
MAAVSPLETLSSTSNSIEQPLKKSRWKMGWKFWKRGSKNEEVIEGTKERRFRANDQEYNQQFKYADNFIKTSKYNLLTFVPVNLFEQFQRIANTYFLILLLLQFIPQISSVSWYTTLIPLVIVLAFSAVKDAYDDIQRHISDRTVNNRKSYVVRNGQLAEEPWSNVKVGDIIRMMSNQFVAADLLLLSTSEPHGIAYIETKELDGETNLKTKAALGETESMGDDLDSIAKFNGEIVCEGPNNKLDKFQGQLQWKQKTSPITNDNIVLRGCILKNTRWCYGVVIFAGRETKLMMNSGKSKFKRTSLDRFLNILILGIVVFLIAMCLICSILCGVWEWSIGRFFTDYLPWETWVPKPESGGPAASISIISFLNFFSYIILLNTVVPISLYVSVEILRFVHSLWINYDRQMYFENGENSVGAQARTTTLNEELGQVQYIFSDKTGTLTQNIMTFNKATINGISYGDLRDPRGNIVEINDRTPTVDFSFNEFYEKSFKFFDTALLDATRNNIPEVREFWLILSLCHTVMPERDKGNLVYQAQSPDEAALTSAARNFGFVFVSRTPTSITIRDNGREATYEVLCILDFNNDRKRMSVILRTPDGKIKLYCKGADMMVMARLSARTSSILRDSTVSHLDEFARIGLRTLCLAYKDIDETYFNDWIRRHQEAAIDMYNREKKMDEVFEEMEKDLILVGATAIEDKLQDGVPEAIARLAQANIKIWVLTGDKTETAINIAYSCNLLSDDMKHIVVIEGSSEAEVEVQLKDTKRLFAEVERRLGENGSGEGKGNIDIAYIHSDETTNGGGAHVNYGMINDFGMIEEGSPSPLDNEGEGVAIVINGDSLGFALTTRLERTFLELACKCKAVICCRVTPLQKAEVVDLVKRNKKAVTLAIGDGANDVSMIKTAHIGVGISGQEGMQAVLSSDYSIGQFKYLERLLLVHGRWSYLRMCKFLRYFFYKNFAFTLTHFWFSFFCGYSAQTVFDAMFIATYNLIFTSLPVLAMGVLDQDVDDEYSLKYPQLYTPGQFNRFFNMRIFIYSVLHGMFSSLVIFFVPYGAFYTEMAANGKDMGDLAVLEFTAFTALIMVVSGQMAFDTAYWTVINHIFLWGSIAVYFIFCFVIYEALPASILYKMGSAISQGVVLRSMQTPHFWFSILLVCIVLLLPVVLNRFFWLDTRPSFADRLRCNRKTGGKTTSKGETLPKSEMKRTGQTRRSQRGSIRSGYAFSHSQGFGDLILKGKLFKNVEDMRGSNNGPPTSGAHLSPIEELSPISQPVKMLSAVGPSPSSIPYSHQLMVNVDPHEPLSVPGQPSPYKGTRVKGGDPEMRRRKLETEDSMEDPVVVRL